MPTPTLVLGAPCWIDLYSSDTEQATSSMAGSRLDEGDPSQDFGRYFTFLKDANTRRLHGEHGEEGHRTRGRSTSPPTTSSAPPRTPSRRAARCTEPMQVAENGSFAIIGDPGGAGIGAWQAGEVTGFEIWNEPGVPRWFELRTPQYDAAVDFYRDVFKWNTHTYSDTPEFRYTTLRAGADDLAGISEHARGHAERVGDLLRRRRHRCRPSSDRRARRRPSPAGPGHAVRPVGRPRSTARPSS